MPIVFSIPVHEQPEVVRNQLDNFLGSTQGTVAVLHVSASAPGLFEAIKTTCGAHLQSGRLLLNPNQVTTHKWSILRPHLSNYQFACQTLEFDRFAFHASNDLLIRPRVDRHIAAHGAAMRFAEFALDDPSWFYPRARADENFYAILNSLGHGQSPFVCSQFEGTFYNRALLDEPMRLIASEYHAWDTPYPKEELLLPSVIARLHNLSLETVIRPYIFVPWGRRKWFGRWGCDYRVTRRDIDQILAGNHPQANNAVIYGVKRVERKLSDPIRQYIGRLMAESLAATSA